MFFKRLLGKRDAEPLKAPVADHAYPHPFPVPDGLPRPDWDAVAQWCDEDPALRPARWQATVRRWLRELGAALGNEMVLHDAPPFLLLTNMSETEAVALLRNARKYLRNLCSAYPGVLEPHEPHESCPIIVFESRSHYWRFVSHYLEPGLHPPTGGMTFRQGMHHIILPESIESVNNVTIAHELVHHLARNRDLPLWMEEAIAVKAEAMAAHHELIPRGGAVQWDAACIQLFWSGQSFRSPDGLQEGSYTLAGDLLFGIPADEETLLKLLRSASSADLGAAAVREHIGCSLGELAAQVLGPGDWEPAFDEYLPPDLEEGESEDPLGPNGPDWTEVGPGSEGVGGGLGFMHNVSQVHGSSAPPSDWNPWEALAQRGEGSWNSDVPDPSGLPPDIAWPAWDERDEGPPSRRPGSA